MAFDWENEIKLISGNIRNLEKETYFDDDGCVFRKYGTKNGQNTYAYTRLCSKLKCSITYIDALGRTLAFKNIEAILREKEFKGFVLDIRYSERCIFLADADDVMTG